MAETVTQVVVEKQLLTYAPIKEYQCGLRWDIEVCFGGHNEDSKDYVSARVYLHDSNVPSGFKAAIKLSIIDKNNKEHVKQSLIRAKYNLPEHNFRVKKDDLLNSSDLLPDNKLTLMCRISFYFDASQATHSEIVDSSRSTSQSQIHQTITLTRIFDNPEYSDFQFIIGETRIKVHKCIVAAHSPVFAAMFRNDMLEKNKNEVEIKDIEVHVMGQLLRFVYGGELEEIDGFADKLFIAADKYELNSLKKLCEQKLIEKLSLQNLYETLRFVDQFDATKLKSVVIQFIIQNSKQLSTMAEFKKSIETLSSSTLAQVLCAVIAKL